MVTIKNKLNQPLVLNIPEQNAIYLRAKEKRDVTEDQFNAPEVKTHIQAGHILVLRLA